MHGWMYYLRLRCIGAAPKRVPTRGYSFTVQVLFDSSQPQQPRTTRPTSIHTSPISSEAFRSTDDKAMCHSLSSLTRPAPKSLRPPLASPGWVSEPKWRVSWDPARAGSGGFAGSPGDGESRTQQPQPLLHHHGSLAAWSPPLDMPGCGGPWPFLESNSSIAPNCGHCRLALSVSSYVPAGLLFVAAQPPASPSSHFHPDPLGRLTC